MVEPIFISPYFLDYILPFVLVFTLVFAVLQKTKLLGEGRKQIDAMISLIIGLILIAFPFSRDIIVNLMPFLAVSLVILLVFMLGYGFIVGKEKDVLHLGMKIALGVIFGLGLLTAILIFSGVWDTVYDFLFGREGASQIWINVFMIAIIVGAVVSVVVGKEGKSGGDK